MRVVCLGVPRLMPAGEFWDGGRSQLPGNWMCALPRAVRGLYGAVSATVLLGALGFASRALGVRGAPRGVA